MRRNKKAPIINNTTKHEIKNALKNVSPMRSNFQRLGLIKIPAFALNQFKQELVKLYYNLDDFGI